MKKIAIISDIHGNMPALDAVLADIKVRGIDEIICLGDIAGKGPSSAIAVDQIKKHCTMVVKGNWDFFISEQDYLHLQWHQDQLGEERLAYMKDLPIYVEFYLSGRLVRLCHASPNDLFHRTFLSSKMEDRLKLFEPTKTLDKTADIVGYGDIHGAHVDNFRGKTIFNTGSVGNPLEITAASYAILEGNYESMEVAPFSVTIVRVPYDIEQAVADALATNMPDKEAYINELRTGVYRGIKKIKH